MTIRRTPDQEAIVQMAVASGLAATPEEFVAEALRNQIDELNRQSKLDDWLRAEVVACQTAPSHIKAYVARDLAIPNCLAACPAVIPA